MALTSKFLGPILGSDLAIYILLGFVALICFYLMSNGKKKRDEAKPKVISKEQREWDTSRNAEVEEFDEEEDFDNTKLVPPASDVDTKHIPYKHLRYSVEESLEKVENFYQMINARRSVRFFSKDLVPKEILEKIIHAAGTAPSGAHTEPWTYVLVKDQEIREKMRDIVEREEEFNYSKRMGEQWVHDLKPLKTHWIKEYLTEAPWVVAVFRQAYYPLSDGRRRIHYYNEISTSLSVGIFLTAVQSAGLVTVTTTPLNCGPALRRLLDRPAHEKLVFLLPVGYPADDALVPDFKRKPLSDILVTI